MGQIKEWCELEEEYLDKIRKFVEKDLMPIEQQIQIEDRIPEDVISKMKELNLFGITIPKEYGGMNLSPAAEMEVLFEFGRTSPAFQAYFGTNAGIGSSGLIYNGSKEQKEKYLRKIASGEIITSFALTEKDTGSDVNSIQCSAERCEEGWILNGKKRFITNSPEASLFNVVARTNEKKYTIFLVDRDNPGLSVGDIDVKMGHKGSHTAEVTLDNCIVKEEDVIGNEGEAMEIVTKVLSKGRLSVAAVATGMCERLLSECTTYSRKRVQFEQRICNFQMIKDKISISASKAYAVKCMVRDAAKRMTDGENVKTESAMCKYFAAEVVNEIADHALQILGGNGYLANNIIESFYRDARLLKIYEGTSEIQKLIISSDVLRKKKILK